jgi:hypothetical protein
MKPGDDDVPRLPRGKGLRLRSTDVARIGMVALLLVCIVVLGRPCASGVAGFVDSFSPAPDAGPAAPATEELQLERLTEEEIRRRFPGDEADAGSSNREGAVDAKDRN